MQRVDAEKAALELVSSLEQMKSPSQNALDGVLERKIEGILVGYHASPAAGLEEEGISTRRKKRGPKIWDKIIARRGDKQIEDTVWVSEDHVYLFNDVESAANYFIRNPELAARPEKFYERAHVYQAEVPLARLDIDPEALTKYAQHKGGYFPTPFFFAEEASAEEINIFKGAKEIMGEVHENFVSLKGDYFHDQSKYDPQVVQLAWDAYKQLSWAKQRLLVKAASLTNPVHQLTLMHRDDILPHRLSQENLATEFTQAGGPSEGYKDFIERRLTENAWPERSKSPFYLGLTDNAEREAYKNCRWIESRKDLDEELAHRENSRLDSERFREIRRQRREQERLKAEMSDLDSGADRESPGDGPNISVQI